MSRMLTLAAVLALAGRPALASPQENQMASTTTRLVPFSGILTDAAGAPASGAQAVTFSLSDEREGGTLLWTETQAVTADARGRLSVYLGAVVPLPLEVFRAEQARWLQVTIDGRDLPRAMLVAVPYTLRAADAETLSGRSLSEFVLTDDRGRGVRADGTTLDGATVDGTGVANQLAKWSTGTTLSSSIITESFDNRLGVLGADPTGGGAVDSRFTIRNPDNNTAIGVFSPFNQRRFALNTLSTGGWTTFDGGSGNWNQGITQADGRVAIGSATFASSGSNTSASCGWLERVRTNTRSLLARLFRPTQRSTDAVRWTCRGQ